MAGISPSTYSGPYTANGSQTAFPFDFTANSSSEVAVEVNGTTVSSSLYTVAIASDYNSGTVTFLTAPTNASSIKPYANPDFTQSSEFENEGAYKLSTVNTINRRSAVRDLWLRAQVLFFSPTGLGTAANRAGKLFGWGGAGEPVFLSGTGADSALRTDLAASGGSALAGFIPTGTGATARSAQAKLRDTLNALDFGATFDGSTDDAAALQAAINAADTQGKVLILPGATAKVNTPLDLRGKYVDIRGVPNKTIIKAGAAIASIFNIEEASEVASYSPLRISGVSLNGNNLVTNANLSLRYRREYVLEDIFSYAAPAGRGFRFRDANNGSLKRCRTNTVSIALHSEGSNHATHHDGCSWIGATTTAVLVENNGALADGNNALLFSGCVLESGSGDGYDVATNCSISINASYTGENQNGTALVARGGTIHVVGGIVYFGHSSTSYVAKPLAGIIRLAGNVQLFSQDVTRGLDYLSGLASGDVATATGKVVFTDLNSQFTISGNPFFYGDVLGYGPTAPTYAPRLGKAYTGSTNNTTVTPATSGNALTVTCASVTGASPKIGVYASLSNQTLWRDGDPLYLVMVYKSTKPLNVRTSTGALGTGVTTIGTAPAASVMSTYVKLDANASATSQSTLEMFMDNAAVSDAITLYWVGFCDAAMIKNGAGVLANLFRP